MTMRSAILALSALATTVLAVASADARPRWHHHYHHPIHHRHWHHR